MDNCGTPKLGQLESLGVVGAVFSSSLGELTLSAGMN